MDHFNESNEIDNLDDSCTQKEVEFNLGSSKVRRTKGVNWTIEETRAFIDLCIERRILKLMDGKRHKHIDVYKSMEGDMKNQGYNKSGSQMQIKLKHLKENYYKCKRHNSVSGAERKSFPFYEEMERLLGSRPSVQVLIKGDVGIDSSSIGSQKEVEEINSIEVVELPDEENRLFLETEESDATDPLEKSTTAGPSNCSNSSRASTTSNCRKSKGRLSNAKKVEDYSENFIQKQSAALSEILTKHNQMMEESIERQMLEQRNWEAQMMQQKREHQIVQMKMLMDGFMQGLHTLSTPQFPPYHTSTFHPNSIPSAHAAQFPVGFPLQVPNPLSSSSSYTVSEASLPTIDTLHASPHPIHPFQTQSPLSVHFPTTPTTRSSNNKRLFSENKRQEN